MPRILLDKDFYSPDVIRKLRDFRGTFEGQLILDRIDFELEKLMLRFDQGRITGTYGDRAASIHGSRKSLRELKNWILQ